MGKRTNLKLIQFIIIILVYHIYTNFVYADNENYIEWKHKPTARLKALAEIEIALPDLFNNFNLYYYNFASAVFQTGSKNLIYVPLFLEFANPTYHLFDNKGINTAYFRMNISEFDVLAIETYYDQNSTWGLNERFSGEIQYAKKILDLLNFGIIIKYRQDYTSELTNNSLMKTIRVSFDMFKDIKFNSEIFNKLDLAASIGYNHDTLLENSIENNVFFVDGKTFFQFGAKLDFINNVRITTRYRGLLNTFKNIEMHPSYYNPLQLYIDYTLLDLAMEINVWDFLLITARREFATFSKTIFGIAYISKNLNIPIEMNNGALSLACEYMPFEGIYLRLGVKNEEFINYFLKQIYYSIGTGIGNNDFHFDISFSFQNDTNVLRFDYIKYL